MVFDYGSEGELEWPRHLMDERPLNNQRNNSGLADGETGSALTHKGKQNLAYLLVLTERYTWKYMHFHRSQCKRMALAVQCRESCT